jgi:hypothetical protein
MENIDDFMRQKFDSDDPAGRFEFREEFWEQAQALIEADEAKRRKRRRWLFWWFFAGLLVAAGSWQLAVGNWQLAVGSWQWAVGSGQWAVGSGQDIVGGGQDVVGREQEAVGSGQGAGGSGQVAVDREQQTGGRAAATGSKGTKNALVKGGLLKKADHQITPAAQGLQPESGKNAGISDDISASDGETNNRRITGAVEKDAKSDGEVALADTAAGQVNISDDAGAEKEAALQPFPVPLQALAWPPRPFDTVTVQVAAPLIKPHREHRLHFGLSAGASLYEPTADGRRIGWSGGVFAAFRFNPAWSASLGLQGRFQPGDKSLPGDSLSSHVLQYSFGYQEDTWTLERRGLCFVEAPLSVQWRRRAFGVEGGIVPGVLLGARGRLIREREASLQDGVSISRRGVWTDDAPYRRVYTAGFIGASWYLNRRLEFSARGFYRPGNLLKMPDAEAPGRQLSVDFGMRLHF